MILQDYKKSYASSSWKWITYCDATKGNRRLLFNMEQSNKLMMSGLVFADGMEHHFLIMLVITTTNNMVDIPIMQVPIFIIGNTISFISLNP